MQKKIRNYGTTVLLVAALLMLAAPAMAEPSTPFVIDGWILYENGTACDNPAVNITNPGTGAEWQAEMIASSNYYQIVHANGTDLNVSETLRFSVTDGVYFSVTDHTVTANEVDDGGLFGFNLTLGPIPGDVNGDGHLTTADAAMVLQLAVRGEYLEVADVSGDRHITSLDALMILQMVAKP